MPTEIPATRASIVRPGEGQHVRAFGGDIEFMLSTEQTGGSIALGLAVVPVGNGPRCAEVFAVPGPPDGAKLAAINVRYGMTIEGAASSVR